MTYDARVKAILDATDNWSTTDDHVPLDFVIGNALTTWQTRTEHGPWFVYADVAISRNEYVAHRIMAVVERAGGKDIPGIEPRPD